MSFLSLSSAQRSAARSAVDYRFTIFLSAIPFHAINSNTSKCWTTAEVQTSHRNGSQLLRFAILIALVPHRRSPRRAAKLYSVQQLTEREKKKRLYHSLNSSPTTAYHQVCRQRGRQQMRTFWLCFSRISRITAFRLCLPGCDVPFRLTDFSLLVFAVFVAVTLAVTSIRVMFASVVMTKFR